MIKITKCHKNVPYLVGGKTSENYVKIYVKIIELNV